MGEILGHTSGLKTSHYKLLEKLYKRKVHKTELLSWDLLREICQISHQLDRQVGVLIHRKGSIDSVVLGERRSIKFPNLPRDRSGVLRLNQYRFIHTNFYEETLSRQDITELLVRRLDLIASVKLNSNGEPGLISIGHLSPNPDETQGVVQLPPVKYFDFKVNVFDFIADMEKNLVKRTSSALKDVHKFNRAIICALKLPQTKFLDQDLEEMKELARSSGLEIIDTIIQVKDKPDLKYCIGSGRLEEVALLATQKEVDYLLFFQNLSPAQAKNIEDLTELKILDRTQLILDIFAQRAQSRDGKLQVELAQLKYMLPRLQEKQSNMSRLVGGIGGRGPGETKLEVHRRRAKDKVNLLEKQIDNIAVHRAATRALRQRHNVPIISIVGYTNAGKSTLLNTLTNAGALAEDKPFATLDPFSKRLKFPREREVILTDTVGFIRDLPPDLLTAFRATLEEISNANLLLHVVDVSYEQFDDRIRTVRKILADLGNAEIPELLVFNKIDRLPPDQAPALCKLYKAIGVSAISPETCHPLLEALEKELWMN